MPIQSPELQERTITGGTTCVKRTLRMRGWLTDLRDGRDIISTRGNMSDQFHSHSTAKLEANKDTVGYRASTRILIVGGV